jgi:WXG100 family type VII secretion target
VTPLGREVDVQRIVADFAELERFERHAQRTIQDIERQLADLEEFLAPLRQQWTGAAAQAWADYQRRWDTAATDLQTSLAELHRVVFTARGNYRAALVANLRMWRR